MKWISNMKLYSFFTFLCIAGNLRSSLEEQATDLLRDDRAELLLLSTLDGTVICVERKTGLVRWKLKDEPVIRVPLKGDFVPMPLFLPDPKDGSLYVLGPTEREAVKKLPFTIPQLVASSPCRSTDGIIYTGKKLDTWFSVNPQTGVKKTVLSFDSAMSCPREGPESIFIGRTEYNLVMMDSTKKEKTWNVTFYDYTSYSMDPENVLNYDYIHFTGSSSGRVVTLNRDTNSFMWQLDHDSPIIAMYLLEPRGLLNVPFTNVAESTLDQLIHEINEKKGSSFGIEFKMNELKLFPTLYIGEHLHGLYALPSLVDKNTGTVKFYERGPFLLEGPPDDQIVTTDTEKYSEGKFKIIKRKLYRVFPSVDEIGNSEDDNRAFETALMFIYLGHYKVPNVNNYVALQIDGRSDVKKIIPNDTNTFQDNRKSSVSVQTDRGFDSLRLGCLQFYEVVVEIISLHNVSHQQIKNLLTISWDIINLAVLQQENLEIKVTILIIIIFVVTMAWYFNKQMKDMQLSHTSKNSDSSNNSRITALPEDIGFGTIQVGKIKLNTSEVLGKGCEGTFVFKGEFDARSVAVKRILPECFHFADREVELLRESDQHENVIRYFCMEQDKQFRYLALELCAATLQEYVEGKFVPENISPMEILLQATRGLQHLHTLNIVHRDIKPNNVLISMPNFNGQVHAMISDFGLCKKLKLGRSSFSRRSGVIGTDGWIAPEMLTGETRTTCSVDVFSLGCLYYYVLTKGSHPFGDTLHRQANIISGNYKLNGFESENELAASLVERMIDIKPNNRPCTGAILKHPIFWNEPKILAFFQDVSDRIEKEDIDNQVLQTLESRGGSVIRGDWRIHIDEEVAQDLRKYRAYRGDNVRDLLRALRNKKHHYRELSEQARKNLGEIPLSFVHYWTNRFPLLLIHTWIAMQCVKSEPVFSDYYESNYNFPELPKRYYNEDLSSYFKERTLLLEDNDFFGKHVLKGIRSAKPNNLCSKEVSADRVENWRLKKREVNLFQTPLYSNNIWFQNWLSSECNDENMFIKWRDSELVRNINCEKIFPEEMTPEIMEHFRKKLVSQKWKVFRSQNQSPKKRPKKPSVRKFCLDVALLKE